MKRFIAILLISVLSGCVSEAPEPNGKPDVSSNAPRAVSVETEKSPDFRNMTTVDYMTAQENELKRSLTGTPAQVVRSNNILAIILPADVFDPENEPLSAETKDEMLQKIADVLFRFHKTRISVIGYADSGLPQTDFRISEERAQSIAASLMKSAKISAVRFWIEGSMPPAVDKAEDRRKNNHVDIILTPTFIR